MILRQRGTEIKGLDLLSRELDRSPDSVNKHEIVRKQLTFLGC